MNNTERTGLVFDELFLSHEPQQGHPECPDRLVNILAGLRSHKLLSGLTVIEPAPAERKWLTEIHSEIYLDELRDACVRGRRLIHSPDNYICSHSYKAALAAAGGVMGAAGAVMGGRVNNAFCAVRPPGHHALRDRAMGFCLINNVAVGTKFLQKKYGIERVLIVDWDVHHGNGTQEAFYEDPGVLFFSIHRYPFYPGSGSVQETGEKDGRGYTINVPMPPGSTDADYLQAFEERLTPAATSFQPGFVLVSAGFDAHRNDPLGGMDLTAGGYAALTRAVKRIADDSCGGRLVSVLEGGYDMQGLAESVAGHLKVLTGDTAGAMERF